MNIVLASSSVWRKKLLEDIGLVVLSEAANVDEHQIWGKTPFETAMLRAQAKAKEVLSRHRDDLIIGADQVCHFKGETIGKPLSEAEWLQRLCKMRGQKHYLTTAVSLQTKHRSVDFSETTTVIFRQDITEATLRRYVEIGEARNCAGGYMMENRGAWLIEKIDGDWQNVIGLPIFSLTEHLRSFGIGFFGETAHG